MQCLIVDIMQTPAMLNLFLGIPYAKCTIESFANSFNSLFFIPTIHLHFCTSKLTLPSTLYNSFFPFFARAFSLFA